LLGAKTTRGNKIPNQPG